jgi:putative chitinase
MSIMQTLVLAGFMGMIGQFCRVIVGLKKRNDTPEPIREELSIARLFITLGIGAVAGVLAALSIGLEKLMALTGADNTLLLGLLAAGYSGTDFIEGFLASHMPQSAGTNDTTTAPNALEPAPAPDTPLQPDPVPKGNQPLTEATGQQVLRALASAPPMAAGIDITGSTTPAMVKAAMPATPLTNIKTHLAPVLAALSERSLGDRPMVCMALGTIAAETAGFVPIDEDKSKYNTKSKPFDLYEPGTPAGMRLGNTTVGDGARYKGRGFVQLTGRDNYGRIGPQVGADLLGSPELANDPQIAAAILAQFLDNHETRIRAALASNNLKKARRLVNGGSHGFESFESTYKLGMTKLPAA